MKMIVPGVIKRIYIFPHKSAGFLCKLSPSVITCNCEYCCYSIAEALWYLQTVFFVANK